MTNNEKIKYIEGKSRDLKERQDSYRNNHLQHIKERILLTLCSRNEFSVKDQNGIYLDGGKEGFKILDCNEVNGWCGKRDSIFADFGAESERKRANQ